jgi:hypothetical protein
MSISHSHELMQQTRCLDSDETPSFKGGLPESLGDKDLDSQGAYHFEKILKIEYPKDFKGFEKSKPGEIKSVGAPMGEDSLDFMTFLKFSRNFDVHSYIEFEFDEAYFTSSLDELITEPNGSLEASSAGL